MNPKKACTCLKCIMQQFSNFLELSSRVRGPNLVTELCQLSVLDEQKHSARWLEKSKFCRHRWLNDGFAVFHDRRREDFTEQNFFRKRLYFRKWCHCEFGISRWIFLRLWNFPEIPLNLRLDKIDQGFSSRDTRKECHSLGRAWRGLDSSLQIRLPVRLLFETIYALLKRKISRMRFDFLTKFVWQNRPAVKWSQKKKNLRYVK